MRSVWKQPLFVIGFSVIAFFLVGSFAYEWLFGNIPRQIFYIEENGRAVEGPPISPKWAYPFGTDQFGYDMLGKLMIGAKYTILPAMAVAGIRMLIAIPIGFVLATYLRKYQTWLSGLFDSLHYVPMTLFAYAMLLPVLWMPEGGFTTTLTTRIVIEIIILAILTLPIVATLIGKEATLLYHQEYVLASKTLGASTFRIITKHLFPQLREKMLVLYGQQVVETLVVFAHLGLLNLFLGGTKVSRDPMFGDPPKSISYEWAGLFGSTFRYLQGAPWLPLGPVICFALIILSIAAMLEGYQRSTTGILNGKKRKKIPALVSEEMVQWNQEQLRKKLTFLKERKK